MPCVSHWLSETWQGELVGRYSEPHRRYHTLRHVHDLLDLLSDANLADRTAVEAAVWFHDAIYDTTHNDNEALSADLARRALQELAFSQPTIDLVTRMILATVRHEPADLPHDGLLFLDADLSILGAPRERYAEYAGQIREEYGWVPEPQFRSGRRAILERFLARPRLYFTEEMGRRFEETARANLAWEVERL